jgi:epoxyqueuosine reductase QueG
MLIQDKARNRSPHLGPYPLETLARDPSRLDLELRRPLANHRPLTEPQSSLGQVLARYVALFMEYRDGDVAPAIAPVPEDLERRSVDVKGLGYFLDADHVGICPLPAGARFVEANALEHSIALVIVVAHGRLPEENSLANGWLVGAEQYVAEMRAGEIAVSLAGYIRQLGFPAIAHVASATGVDLDRLMVPAGVGVRTEGGLISPYLGDRFSLAAVTTDYQLAVDEALAADHGKVMGRRFKKGINGAVSGKEWARRRKRATHLSRYPMEQIKRVERPTTLILDHEIPRVPKRAAFFTRAAYGDLGEKSQREVQRFAYKHPATAGMMHLIRGMVPHQDGEPATALNTARYDDPSENAKAIKSLGYHLGADLIGVCEIPRYAWFSHQLDGSAIEPYHRYAVVMLIDQGFDTMEGASGDDWVSGAQSMRGYLRGAEIAGVMAEFLRGEGFSSRPQTNADSDVLHIPLILWAGLGELSRIGELVLNPYVGPRFKSVVITTDMPLQIDKPIDFGLQYFCNHCLKCARECPCNAIPFGDKVMFNGYEIWKPDVERCTRYRITNQKGAACGRCMKTCPLNKVVTSDGGLALRMWTWLGVNAGWLKPLLVPIATYLDDRLGFGMRNPIKKWWLDLEIVDGVCVAADSNQRDLDVTRKIDASKSTVGYYHADMMPAANASEPVPVDHKLAVAAAQSLETPAQASIRQRDGGAKPSHYIPTVDITDSIADPLSGAD